MKISLLTLGALFLTAASPAFSATTRYDLQAPTGFIWKEDIDRMTNRVNLELWSKESNEKTEVFYTFDLLSGGEVDHESIDSKFEVIAPTPGKTLWAPHPEVEKSLEDKFLEDVQVSSTFRAQNEPKENRRIIRANNRGDIVYAGNTDFFQTVKRVYLPETFSDLILKVTDRIRDTEAELFSYATNLPKGIAELKPIQKIIANRDFIEPVKSQIGSTETRLDAFNLYPLETLKTYGDQVTDALAHLARKKDRYLWDWCFGETKRPWKVRLSVMMLVTHNHLTEAHFLRGVLAKYGVKQAFESAKAINQIYENERLFWKTRHRENKNMNYNMDKTEIDFLDERYSWEVNISYKARVLAPLFRDFFPEHQEKDEEWVPYIQLYHYYGGMISALRMLMEYNVRESLIPSATLAIGVSYKSKTAGTDARQLNLMRLFYGAAAKHAIALREWGPAH